MVRKLYLSGSICNRTPTERINHYYSWPLGASYKAVDDIIAKFKKAFCHTSTRLEHILLDD